jgi:hypothetical protein
MVCIEVGMNPIEVYLPTFGHTPLWWQNFINDLRAKNPRDTTIHLDIDQALAQHGIERIAWDNELRYAKLIFNDPKQYTWFILRWS